jgi:hypothetical protein
LKPATTPPPDLNGAVLEFAERIIRTTSGVLGRDIGFTVDVGMARDGNQSITVNQSDPLGIAMTVSSEPMFRLVVSYRCEWHAGQHFFAVESSVFKLQIENVNEPLLHFDYGRGLGSSVPVAHINLHAHRDELVYAMMSARRHRGKTRSKQSAAGTIPRIASLHLPVGGHRFRPSLEDVLQMLIFEFGIDAADGAQDVLDEGREHYRSIQVSAAVSDNLPMAADALRRAGYTVTAPDEEPAPKRERLIRY